MRKSAIATLVSFFVLSNPQAAELSPQLSYSIALQNEDGVETQVLALPLGGETRKLNMVGGMVEVTPPVDSAAPSVIRLFADGQPERVLHTARIGHSQGQSIRIAYSLCGGKVSYQSPAPDKLDDCAARAR